MIRILALVASVLCSDPPTVRNHLRNTQAALLHYRILKRMLTGELSMDDAVSTMDMSGQPRLVCPLELADHLDIAGWIVGRPGEAVVTVPVTEVEVSGHGPFMSRMYDIRDYAHLKLVVIEQTSVGYFGEFMPLTSEDWMGQIALINVFGLTDVDSRDSVVYFSKPSEGELRKMYVVHDLRLMKSFAEIVDRGSWRLPAAGFTQAAMNGFTLSQKSHLISVSLQWHLQKYRNTKEFPVRHDFTANAVFYQSGGITALAPSVDWLRRERCDVNTAYKCTLYRIIFFLYEGVELPQTLQWPRVQADGGFPDELIRQILFLEGPDPNAFVPEALRNQIRFKTFDEAVGAECDYEMWRARFPAYIGKLRNELISEAAEPVSVPSLFDEVCETGYLLK